MDNEQKKESVLNFWFEEITPEDWFGGGDVLDEMIANRFKELHCEVSANEHWTWRTTPKGSLAEIIVLDQFSRNIFRGDGKAFASDSQALALAQVAVDKGFDKELTEVERQFLYMPYMHSESRVVHEEALRLFTELGDEGNLKYEKIHKTIIDQFGRYPHRNKQLGRESAVEEISYLESESQGFFNS